MLPPPAPTVWTSTIGSASARPPTSRKTPAVSCEVDTCEPGWSSSTRAATRCSCSGWRKPHSRQTATDSASSRPSLSRSPCSSSGRSTPSGPLRSGTGTRRSGGTSGGGWPAHRRYSSARACRPSSSKSVKPSVASSVVRATLLSSSAFVPTVMPCTKRSTSSASALAAASASRTASTTPSDWSAGGVGALPVTSRSPVSRTASVKVPPTSTPRITPGTLPGNDEGGPRAAFEECSLHRRLEWTGGSRELSLFLYLRRDDPEVLLEMLVRRAVLAAGQRYALAGGPLAGAGVAAQWAAVEGHAGLGLAVDVVRGQLDMAFDNPEDADLLRHREVPPHVVEESLHRLGEVVTVECQALHGRLASAKETLPGHAHVLARAR